MALDGREDRNANGRVDPGETDGLNADTDADGLDGREVNAAGTDPTRPDTDGDGPGDGLELGVSGTLTRIQLRIPFSTTMTAMAPGWCEDATEMAAWIPMSPIHDAATRMAMA